MKSSLAAAALVAAFISAAPAAAQPYPDVLSVAVLEAECPAVDPRAAPLPQDPILRRVLRYADVAARHRLAGLASYYSACFDGRPTANGETFRNRRYSAAHLTLPLGSWVEVRSRATGKRLRLRVNDRGPYARKFCLDLSRAAARYLGVDVDPDRYVEVRIIALPGEEPIPEDVDVDAILAGGASGEAKTAAVR